jgi:hypothetical protein
MRLSGFFVGAIRWIALGSAVDHFTEKQGDPAGRPYVGG